MKNTNKRPYGSDIPCMDTLKPVIAPGLPPELKTLMQSKQKGTSDSYYRPDPAEFCAWGYPMDLGNY